MGKLTKLDKAIASVDEQIRVLQLVRAHLIDQQRPEQPKLRRPRVVKPEPAAARILGQQ